MNYILNEIEYADYCKIIQEHAKLKEEQKEAYKKAQKLGNADICVKIADETLNEMIRETDSRVFTSIVKKHWTWKNSNDEITLNGQFLSDFKTLFRKKINDYMIIRNNTI